MEDYYKILGVNKNATKSEISRAYKNLALKLHPDKGGNEYLFKKVNEAYKVLMNKSHQMVPLNSFPSLFDMGGLLNMNKLFEMPKLFDMTNFEPKNGNYYSETIESVYHNGKGRTKRRINKNGKVKEYWY